jgi:hypothetical protein
MADNDEITTDCQAAGMTTAVREPLDGCALASHSDERPLIRIIALIEGRHRHEAFRSLAEAEEVLDGHNRSASRRTREGSLALAVYDVTTA